MVNTYVQFVHMLNTKTFYVSEARSKLFEILRLVAKGEDIILYNKDTDLKYRVTLHKAAKKNKKALLKKATKVNLTSMSPEEMKKIFESRLDPCWEKHK